MRLERKIISLILVVLLLITSISVITTSTYANSYEKAMFIMEHLNITQGVNGSFSHQGTNAIDIAGKDSGIDSAYAPFTGTVKRIYQGYVVWFESNSPVLFADGSVDYMTIMVMHDNDTSDLYVGKTIKQGEHFFDEGTTGYATGNHIHLECGKGKFQGNGWYKNSNGQWTIYNSVLPYDALYLSTGTVVKNNYNYPWKNANDSVPSFTYDSIENGEYYLKNVATGTYLSVDGGVDAQAQNVSVVGFTGGNEMKFSLVSESNGYAIRPLCSSSRMLNVYADNVVSQKNVCIYDNTNHGSQRWYFESVDSGYVIHNSQNPNCVLDVYGTNVWVYDSYGAQSQKWVLEPVDKVEYPGTPVLKVTASTAESYTQFLFGNTDNTDEYELKIHDANTGERVYYYTAIQGTNFQAQLEKGTYIAYPVAVNNDLRGTDRWWTSGSGVSFTVGDAKSVEAVATTTYEDSKYALYDVVMPWSEAKFYCESMGGHLVTMASKEEYEAIQNLILKGNSAVYWIGYTDDANEGDFAAINGEKNMYTVWDDGEPNDYESNEDCAVLTNNSNSKMNDLNNMYANYSVGFICEFKVEPETDPETEPSHTHEYVLTESVPADCTHTGHDSYKCSCGDGYIEWFEPNGKHVYSEEWTVLHTPTETERGVGCKLCVYCNTQGHYIRINQDWSYEYVNSPNPDDWIEDDVVEGDIMRWFKEYSAEIADENTGDIRFFWSEVEDAINYNLMVYTEEGTSLLNITTTELNYVWSPEQYDSGIFFITATSNEGKVFAKSGGTHFARNHNLINQNYGVYGDVDNNGKINIKDATLVQKSLAHVVELDITSEVLADVNADGKINIKDATTIQKHCAFISVTSRIGEKCTTGIPKYSIKVNQ